MDINTIREDLQHLADRLRHELAACERAIAALDGNETPDVVNETSNSAAALQP